MPALLENREEADSDSEDNDSSDHSELGCKEQEEESVHPKDRPAETSVDKKVSCSDASSVAECVLCVC